MVAHSPAENTTWRSSGLKITMRDAGPGIPGDEQERVFEPFFRGRDAAAVEGTGMGLSIVRDAVDVPGGSISLETRFKLARKAFTHTASYDKAIAGYLKATEFEAVRNCYKIQPQA